MKLIKTAAVALAVGFAVVSTAAPAQAFFLHKKACTAKDPVVSFFEQLFGCKK